MECFPKAIISFEIKRTVLYVKSIRIFLRNRCQFCFFFCSYFNTHDAVFCLGTTEYYNFANNNFKSKTKENYHGKAISHFSGIYEKAPLKINLKSAKEFLLKMANHNEFTTTRFKYWLILANASEYELKRNKTV